MSYKTVPHQICGCGKRSFEHERLAEKALGRARTKRLRRADAAGTRRGAYVENRAYECPFGGLHLTSESRRSFNSRETIYA